MSALRKKQFKYHRFQDEPDMPEGWRDPVPQISINSLSITSQPPIQPEINDPS